MNNKNSRKQAQTCKEELPLDKAASLVLDESRMVLPGIQALFGFQLIVVFNDAFTQKLNIFEQRLHLLAIALVLIATMIIFIQAVFHRQTAEKEVASEFIRIASRLLLLSMFPVVTSICIEFYLISRVILNDVLMAVLFTLGIFCLFLLLWVGLPRIAGLRHLLAK
ncbi:MAG: DUF6328 family protein [Bacteroidota bacterium]